MGYNPEMEPMERPFPAVAVNRAFEYAKRRSYELAALSGSGPDAYRLAEEKHALTGYRFAMEKGTQSEALSAAIEVMTAAYYRVNNEGKQGSEKELERILSILQALKGDK